MRFDEDIDYESAKEQRARIEKRDVRVRSETHNYADELRELATPCFKRGKL